MASGSPYLIVGGGIGGLSCALALAHKGLDVQLFEQAHEFTEIGAGIQMGPNMIHALGCLGLKERVLDDAWTPGNLVMRDALDGSMITRIPLDGGFRELFDDPYAVTHRADLHAPIYEAVRDHPGIELRTGAHVRKVTENGVRLDGGESVAGAAVIGADGLWSCVRAHVIGDGEPRVAGHIAYRAVLRRDQVPEDLWTSDVTLWAGPGTHFVHYPLRRGELYNLVAVFHSTRYAEGWDQEGDTDELWKHFSGQVRGVWALLEQIETWKYWVLCDREPQRGWTRGAVTLLGDAAHPTLQYMAQGAAMAIEDALCLADELEAAGGDAATAFPRYEDRRVLRTARVQLTSRFYGDVYHARGPAAELRAQVLGGRSPQLAWAGMSWLYGYKERP